MIPDGPTPTSSSRCPGNNGRASPTIRSPPWSSSRTSRATTRRTRPPSPSPFSPRMAPSPRMPTSRPSPVTPISSIRSGPTTSSPAPFISSSAVTSLSQTISNRARLPAPRATHPATITRSLRSRTPMRRTMPRTSPTWTSSASRSRWNGSAKAKWSPGPMYMPPRTRSWIASRTAPSARQSLR